LRSSETKEIGYEKMAAQDKMAVDKYSGCGDNEQQNVPNSTNEKEQQHNWREIAKKKGKINMAIDNSTQESGNVTTPGELLATKMSESVSSHADELLHSDKDSGFAPIAA